MSAPTTRTRTARTHAVAPHSCVLHPAIKTTLATSGDKYGRLFPHLAAEAADDADLLAPGRAGAPMDLAAPMPMPAAGGADDSADAATDNPRIPAGWPIYEQFIAHDITADRLRLRRVLRHAAVVLRPARGRGAPPRRAAGPGRRAHRGGRAGGPGGRRPDLVP